MSLRSKSWLIILQNKVWRREGDHDALPYQSFHPADHILVLVNLVSCHILKSPEVRLKWQRVVYEYMSSQNCCHILIWVFEENQILYFTPVNVSKKFLRDLIGINYNFKSLNITRQTSIMFTAICRDSRVIGFRFRLTNVVILERKITQNQF